MVARAEPWAKPENSTTNAQKLALGHNPHGSVPARVVDEMTRAGYELVQTHDLVRGHWFGVFRVAADR